MSVRPDPDRAIVEWLRAEATSGAPGRLVETTRAQLESTHQRRAWWPARRFTSLNTSIRLALTAVAAVAVVAVVGVMFWPRSGGVATPGPTPSQSAAPPPSLSAPPSPTQSAAAASTALGLALPEGTLAPGTYVMVPCSEMRCTTSDESIHLTIDVPSGWSGVAPAAIWIDENTAPGGAALGIGFGGDLPRDPCLTTDLIDTGSTVDGFANAIATHPVLDATDPVDVSLDGYSGKYIDLRLPADLSSCPEFRPFVPGIYAQGPNHQWHLWILDVTGTRVVVNSMDYPGTSSQRRAELQAMVQSIQIEP